MNRPNILILLSDQLRRQALGCYGDPDARTPNMDGLARDGVRFTAANATYPVCVPFRFTLMTGEYAHSRLAPAIEWAMSPAERTLADEFNERDYETVYIGKWHLDGGHGRMGSAKQCGMTPVRRSHRGRWCKWLGFELRNDPFDTYYFEDEDPMPRKIEGYQTDGLYDLGMDYLANRWNRQHPFCMCISVEPPHPPLIAPPDLQQAWEARDLHLPPNFEAFDEKSRAQSIKKRQIYHAMVENLDINVGRILGFLEMQGLADHTVVMLTSDHGELGGAHGLHSKQWPYEESVGIPLIVRDPGIPPARRGTTVDDPVCTEDLFPTLLGLAGLAPRNPLPGRDLTPLMHGKQEKLDREGVLLQLVAEHRKGFPFYEEVWRGLRTRRYKYTVKGDKFGGKPWQFFDLDQDPFERENLIDHPEAKTEIVRHHGLLAKLVRETQDPFVLLPAFDHEGVNLWETT